MIILIAYTQYMTYIHAAVSRKTLRYNISSAPEKINNLNKKYAIRYNAFETFPELWAIYSDKGKRF
jgi:hypothetical protein